MRDEIISVGSRPVLDEDTPPTDDITSIMCNVARMLWETGKPARDAAENLTRIQFPEGNPYDGPREDMIKERARKFISITPEAVP